MIEGSTYPIGSDELSLAEKDRFMSAMQPLVEQSYTEGEDRRKSEVGKSRTNCGPSQPRAINQ